MPKKIYYGYVIVAAATISLMVAYSSYYIYSVFFNSLAGYFHSTEAAISGAFSLTVVLSGVISIFAGNFSDRFGPKAITLVCGSSMGLGLLLMSLVHSVWHVYAIYGVLIGIGVGGLFPAAMSTIARWFTSKRGMMIGIASAGLGLGTIIFSPLIAHFITTYDWRRAYVITGIIVLVVTLTAAQFLKRQPEGGVPVTLTKTAPEVSKPATGDFTFRQALRTRQLWMLVVVYMLSGYGQFSVIVHIVPYATGLGISPVSAAAILSVIGGASIFGRLIIGGVGDRIKVKPLLIGILAILLVSLACLEFSRNLWALIGVGIIFGLGYGGSSTLQSLVAVEMFGLSSLGVMLGAFIFSICIGGSIGPVITGYLYDQSVRFSATPNYNLSFLICIITAAVSLLLVLWLTPVKARK
jgi:MFS family permease